MRNFIFNTKNIQKALLQGGVLIFILALAGCSLKDQRNALESSESRQDNKNFKKSKEIQEQTIVSFLNEKNNELNKLNDNLSKLEIPQLYDNIEHLKQELSDTKNKLSSINGENSELIEFKGLTSKDVFIKQRKKELNSPLDSHKMSLEMKDNMQIIPNFISNHRDLINNYEIALDLYSRNYNKYLLLLYNRYCFSFAINCIKDKIKTSNMFVVKQPLNTTTSPSPSPSPSSQELYDGYDSESGSSLHSKLNNSMIGDPLLEPTKSININYNSLSGRKTLKIRKQSTKSSVFSTMSFSEQQEYGIKYKVYLGIGFVLLLGSTLYNIFHLCYDLHPFISYLGIFLSCCIGLGCYFTKLLNNENKWFKFIIFSSFASFIFSTISFFIFFNTLNKITQDITLSLFFIVLVIPIICFTGYKLFYKYKNTLKVRKKYNDIVN